MCRFMISREEPVFSTNGKRSDTVFDQVVINFDMAIFCLLLCIQVLADRLRRKRLTNYILHSFFLFLNLVQKYAPWGERTTVNQSVKRSFAY
jgi:hypothetical protein